MRGREAILKVHTKKIPLGDDVELSMIARGTPRFAGADLANLVNEAALIAARQNRKVVMMVDFEMAKDKVLMGVERKSRLISEGERKHTAYHEAGHALVAARIPEAMPLHKVTIIPRGMALGVTMFLPEGDQVDYTKEQAEAQIAVSMGGRIADEIFCNMKSAGASNDIEKATELSRKMVCEWGMSDLGPLSFGKKEEQIFLGREIATHRDFSEHTARRIDQQVQNFVTRGYDRARGIIEQHREAMIRIAEALLEREVLDSNEVRMLIEGTAIPAMKTAAEGGKSQPVPRPEGNIRVPGLMEGAGPQPA
jgi:cell division protease FtsH